MIVVSDTSPITALLTVGSFDLLPKLFGEVVIPRAVESELLAEHVSLPVGLRVVDVTNLDLVTFYQGQSTPAKRRLYNWRRNWRRTGS
jgi:predicted nucleic acid-binding protein